MASSARVSRLSFHFMWVCFKQILVIVVVSLAVQVIAYLKVQSTTQIMLPIDEDDGWNADERVKFSFLFVASPGFG